MNTLFLVAMIIEGIVALGFISIPGTLMGQFGLTLDASGASFVRMLGAALLSYPVLLWYGRRSDKTEFKIGVARALFIYYLASIPIMVITITTGLMNVKGWSLVVLHLALLVWFGAYAFRTSRS